MKKLITLTALLLCAVVSSWAATETVSWTDMAISNHDANKAGTASNVALIPANGVVTGLQTNGTVTKDFGSGSTTYYRYKGFAADENTNLYFEYSFAIASGYSFTPSKISVGWAPNGGKAVCFNVYAGTSSENLTKIGQLIHASDNTYSVDNINVSSEFTLIRLVPFGKASSIVLNSVTITGDLVNSSLPSLNVSTENIKLSANPITTSKNAKFTLTGNNLTDGTYNLTIPSVAGLSVSPTNFTVADGAVNQEFTVTYTSTVDVAEAVANITATVDKIEANVAVTYSSRASLLELAAISGATTWDFSKITANTESERYGDNGIKLSNETTPSITDDVVYENYNGIDYTLADDFDGTTIAFQGEFPIRKNSYCQNGTIHFKTSVPGTIIVKFSDTGTSASNKAVKRYLVVNGNTTEYWASRENNGTENPYAAQLNVTSGEIYVPAGDVTITGTAALVYSSVEFNATLPETTKVTVGEACYRTFASKYPLDFTGGVSGLKAYKATVSGSTVTFSEVKGKVPAKGGLLLKAAAQGEYTISVSADEPTEFNNALVGVIKATDKAAGIYVLMDGAQGVGFYKTVNTFEVGDNTAYLPADVVAGARTFIGFDEEGEATGIETIERVQTTDTFFNLNGQRVAAPQKGLYIVNGKKVILK